VGQDLLAEIDLATSTAGTKRKSQLMIFTIMVLQSKIDLVGEGGGQQGTLIKHLHNETQKLCQAGYVQPTDEIVSRTREVRGRMSYQ